MSHASLTPSRMGIMTSLRTVTSYFGSLWAAGAGVCCPSIGCPDNQRVAVPASRNVMAQQATNAGRGVGVPLAMGWCKACSWRWESSARLMYTWPGHPTNEAYRFPSAADVPKPRLYAETRWRVSSESGSHGKLRIAFDDLRLEFWRFTASPESGTTFDAIA